MKKNRKGTLVELLVVIVILGIITGLSIPLIRNLSSSMEKKKYKTYNDSLVNAAKLYNDSYSEDLFGHNENGCAYVTYGQLIERNLLKDIEISDISCNSSSTFVRILKIGDKYSYSPFLGCGKKKDGKAKSIDTTLPIANQENVMKPEYCTGTEENNLEIIAEPLKSEAYDKKKKKTKIKITSGTGINPKMVISYKWSTSNTNVSGTFTSLSFKVPGDQKAKLLNGEIISTSSADITTPEATGKYYLILKVEQLQDLYGSRWVNKKVINNLDSKHVAFGPFAVDMTPPTASFDILSTDPNYNSLNTTIKVSANDTEVGKNLKYCISKVNNNCNPTTIYKDGNSTSLKMDGTYDGKERIVYIAVMDLAGNITRINKKYKVDKQYIVYLDGNDATTPGSLSTTVIYNDIKLGTIINPKKVVSISYVNRVGATVSGGDTSKTYSLNGWYTSKDSGSKVASNATTPLLQANVSGYTNGNKQWIKASETTLYAHWNSTVANLPKVTKIGYTCHWETNYNGTSSVASEGTWTFTAANSRTFTAVCTPNTYKVNLNGNGQTQNGSASTTATYDATTLKAITNPRKIVSISYVNNVGATVSGGHTSREYSLNGWYTSASGGSKVASNSTTPALQANVSGYTNGNKQWIKMSESTLYAHWDNVTATLPTVTKAGNTCKWTTDGGEVASGGTWTFSSANSRTFTASCSSVNYSITYNLNGGSVSPANKTSYNVETATFTLTNPTRAGYTFTGWSGTGLSGSNNKTVTIAKGSTGNRSYTANWAKVYKIKYNMNTSHGGTGATQVGDTGCSYGSTCDLPSSVANASSTKSSRTFVGWYTSPTGGSKLSSVKIDTPSDKTVYAHWTGWQLMNDLNPMSAQQWSYWSNSVKVNGWQYLPADSTHSYWYYFVNYIAHDGWEGNYYLTHQDINGDGTKDCRMIEEGECRWDNTGKCYCFGEGGKSIGIWDGWCDYYPKS